MNQLGLDLVRAFEGCKLTAYRIKIGPWADIWTIGWGHTGPDVRPNMTITQATADALLEHDLNGAEMDMKSIVGPKINLSDNESAALTSFVFNLGGPRFAGSTLLRYLRKNDKLHAANEFLKWNRAGGVPVSGLTRRRMAERDLFMRTA